MATDTTNDLPESNVSSGTIQIKKSNLKYFGLVLLIVLVLCLYLFVFKSNTGTTGNVIQNPSGNNPPTDDPTSVTIDTSDAPMLGNANAKVTIVEFSNFSCPFCAAASGDNPQLTAYMQQRSPSWQPPVSNLIKDYVDTGKVKLYVKYSYGHTGGHPAQLVVWCLNDQGLYWKFYPKAYAQQSDVENLTRMQELAKSLNADMTKLQSCLDSKKYDSQFDKDAADGTAAGVQGTPSFFINGKAYEGAQSYSVIKQAIDAELAK